MSYVRANGRVSSRLCGLGGRACVDLNAGYTLGDTASIAVGEPTPAAPAATASTISQGAIIAAGAVVLLLLTNRRRAR